jgi:hypothetical protein
MNRRVVLPVTIVGLALCFAILALPVSGPVSASRLQETQAATADACNPEPAVPGTILSTLFVLDQPNNSGVHLIKVINTDVVEVLGKTTNGFWLVVRTNSGIVGWVPSPQVFIDKKMFANATLVPVWEGDLPAAAAATDVAPADGATADAAAANGDCPTIDGVITADAFQLQVAPLTNSGDVGKRVRKGERVIILARNASGSWAKVQAETGEIGWITTSYTEVPLARLDRVRIDYTFVEATLTPRP